jgi:hypothetical protein
LHIQESETLNTIILTMSEIFTTDEHPVVLHIIHTFAVMEVLELVACSQ